MIRLFLLATIVCGCRGREALPATVTLSDGTVVLNHAGLVTDSLHGELILATPAIGDPRFMALTGPWLWISDRSGDPYLHLVDLTGEPAIASRGTGGEGPGDYGEVPQLSIRLGDSAAVWAYDASLRRLTREPVEPDGDRRVIRFLGGGSGAYSMQWQDVAHLVGIGDVDTNRIILADSTGAIVRLVQNALLGPDSVPVDARRAISSGYAMCVRPGPGGIAVLYLAAGQVDLYGPDGAHRGMADVPFPSDGQWVINQRGRLWFRVDWNYYVSCSATERYLYGLFTGQRIDGPAGPVARRGLHVHVFDWEGRLRAVWSLERPASAITVSGDTVLFAIGQEGEGLFRYQVPNLP